MIDEYLSKKIRIISFFSMILVVLLHSYNLGEEIIEQSYSKKGFVFFIQYFISQGIARIAVPVFFTISGYLFFLKKTKVFDDYILNIQKKLKSLVLPYLLWSIFGFILFFLLQIFPQTAIFFKSKHLIDYTFYEIFNVIFLHPIPFQLWFIRDLCLFILLSPLFLLLIKYLKLLYIAILIVAWFLHFDFIFFSTEGIMFFSLGSFFAFNKLNIGRKQEWLNMLIILWLLLVLCETALYTIGFDNFVLLHALHKVNIVIGISSIWFFYDFLERNTNVLRSSFFSFSAFSFFVYAFHEPFLEFLKIILFKLLGRSNFSMLSIYLISPIIMISFCFFIGVYLKKHFPVLFSTITGAR